MMNTLWTIILFALVGGTTCIGQTSFKGLTPGRSTKADVVRLLGQPIRVVQATLVEYKSGKGTKIFVQYGENDSVVERIEAVYPDKVERATLIRSLNLPARPTASHINERGRLEEYFATAKIVLTYAAQDAGSGVSSVGYYGRELFESAVAKLGGIPAAREGQDRGIDSTRAWRPIQQASINQGDGEVLTFYGGTTPAQCQADCDKNPRCKAFTFIRPGAYSPNDPQMCYLMSQVQKLTPSTCCISAVKNEEQR